MNMLGDKDVRTIVQISVTFKISNGTITSLFLLSNVNIRVLNTNNKTLLNVDSE